MVTKDDVIFMLYGRFKDVPGMDSSDVESVVSELITVFELDDEDIPATDLVKYMAFASAEMAMKIALNTAHYFRFTDGEESIDKTLISENYRKVAAEYRRQYDAMTKDESRRATSSFRNAHRIDRPPFQW